MISPCKAHGLALRKDYIERLSVSREGMEPCRMGSVRVHAMNELVQSVSPSGTLPHYHCLDRLDVFVSL
jgi:hypothetical protein